MKQTSLSHASRAALALLSVATILSASTAWASSSSSSSSLAQSRSSSSYSMRYRPSSSSSSAPSVAQVEQMINTKTGIPFKWNKPEGNWPMTQNRARSRAMHLTGTGTMGQDLSVTISCIITYPPLRAKCTINFNL